MRELEEFDEEKAVGDPVLLSGLVEFASDT